MAVEIIFTFDAGLSASSGLTENSASPVRASATNRPVMPPRSGPRRSFSISFAVSSSGDAGVFFAWPPAMAPAHVTCACAPSCAGAAATATFATGLGAAVAELAPSADASSPSHVARVVIAAP